LNRTAPALALVAALFTSGASCLAGGAGPPSEAALGAAAIFDRVAQMNEARAARLRAYVSSRRYSVFEPGHDADAELVASMTFVAPSTKTFTTVSETGVGWIHRRVFGRLMEAEREAAAGTDHRGSSITPANYNVELVGHDTYRGRDCYVLQLLPKRPDKYLLKGRAWIDAEDFAIARLVGEPVRSPSFWVVHAPFVREYQRIDTFWLPLQDETHTQIRFVGQYVLRIAYGNYRITARTTDETLPAADSPSTRDSAGGADTATGGTP
jgi:hypothetical protein